MSERRVWTLGLSAILAGSLFPGPAFPLASSGADGGGTSPGDSSADPRSVIAASHRKSDDDLKRSLMSPFTAVGAHYLEAGKSSRVGADSKGVTFDPESTMPVVGSLSYEDGVFWISPGNGAAAPTVRKAKENGELEPGDGKPVTEKMKLGDGEVLSLYRFLVEMSPQSGMGRALVHDPDSPARKAFTGLKWFDPDLGLQVPAVFKPNPSPDKITVGTTRGLKKEFYRIGAFEFSAGGAPQRLTVLAPTARPADGDGIFVPFRDATTGKESYDVGRYLNMTYHGPDFRYVIDFNDAGNPNCNYSPWYNCPIPPVENTLAIPIRAGEMTYPAHP